MHSPDSSQKHSAAASLEETGHKIRRSVRRVVLILAIGFVIVFCIKLFHEHRLKNAAEEAENAAPLVETVVASKASSTLPLMLPGETAAWYESIIYARVDGFVGNWTADIGDKVKKGQVLATIETPDLDAQLAATKALILSRKAAADFARTTYERWRGSPKGVVSSARARSKERSVR